MLNKKQRSAPPQEAESPLVRRTAATRLQLRTGQKCVVLAASAAEDIILRQSHLVRRAAARGHEVHCLVPEPEPALRGKLRRLGARIIPLPDHDTRRAARNALHAIAETLELLRPDVVAAFSLAAGHITLSAARHVGVPRIIAAFPELTRPAPSDSERARMSQEALTMSHAAIIPGTDGRSSIGRPPPAASEIERFFIPGPGVDLAAHPQAPLPHLGKGVFFFMPANPHALSALEHFCDAARALHAKARNARWLVATTKSEQPPPPALALLRAHRGIVRYIGPRANAAPLLARTHVAVFADAGPQLPGTLVQALAVGRPVIATHSCGDDLAVREGENGLRVETGDVEGLAEAMTRLLRRPDLLPKMADASRRIAVEHFDASLITTAMMKALGL